MLIPFDLTTLSDEELEGLRAWIEKDLAWRKEMREEEAREQVREIARGVGMTPEELGGVRGR
jgi:hypothetical protein